MDVINESGVLYRPSLMPGYGDVKGFWVPVGAEPLPFYYSKVVWIDTLKFVFGWNDKQHSNRSFDAMVEVSTMASAVTKEELSGKATIDNYIQKYKEKLASHSARCGEQVVENFKFKFTIQLWQINLWIL